MALIEEVLVNGSYSIGVTSCFEFLYRYRTRLNFYSKSVTELNFAVQLFLQLTQPEPLILY